MNKFIKIFLPLVFISALLSYHYFVNVKVPAYPWWHQHGNDIDGSYAGQTVALLNHGPLDFIDHPGGTIYMLHGAVYRVLSNVAEKYSLIKDLGQVPSIDAATQILEISVQTSRLIVFFATIAFLITFYGVIYHLTNSSLLSFFFSFLFCTNVSFTQHMLKIRPELPNLLFFLAALWLFISICKKTPLSLFKKNATIIGIGLLIGLSLLSKVQIIPIIIIFWCVSVFYLLNNKKEIETKTKALWMPFYLSLVNLLIMPWWSIKRPAFLNTNYFDQLSLHSDKWKVYGSVPENFYLLVFTPLFMFLLITVILLALNNKKRNNPFFKTAVTAINFANFVNLGIILSIYLLLLPVSLGFKHYWQNTQHLVYSFLANATGGGFLTNPSITFNTFVEIYKSQRILCLDTTVSLFPFIGVACLAAILRLSFSSLKNKSWYLLILLLFATGLLMDTLASMRKLYGYYAIYSQSLHVMGLALWTSLEWKNIQSKKLRITFQAIIVILLSAHCIANIYHFANYPKATGASEQNPFDEYQNTRSHAKPFWQIADQSIIKNNKSK